MEPLKASSTIIDKHALAQFLNENYRFNCQVKLLKAGVNHSYHVINDEDEYVFRIYAFEWRSLAEINAEIDHLLFLKNKAIPVSYPIATPSNTYVSEILAFEGLRYGVLFSYAKGEKLLTFDEDLHFKVGSTMAKMHKLVLNKEIQRVVYDEHSLLEDTFKYLPDFLPVDSVQYHFLSDLKTYLYKTFQKIKSKSLRIGITHMDIWFDNMNINGNEITFFDFDFCGNGWLAFDIAYYIMQIHSTEVDIATYNQKKNAFLKGYESISEIPNAEKDILPQLGLAIFIFYIGVQCKRFDNWSNTFLNEMHLKRLIDLRVKRWFDFNQLQF